MEHVGNPMRGNQARAQKMFGVVELIDLPVMVALK